MTHVHRKTDKGRQEIATRASGLPPRLRSALILVDGKRDDAALAELLQPDGRDRLQALATQGFIEPVAAVAPAAAQAPAAGAPKPGRAGADLAESRREAVRALVDLIGPHADDLALRMEKAADRAALDKLVDLGCRRLEMLRGKEVAQRYGERFGGGG